MAGMLDRRRWVDHVDKVQLGHYGIVQRIRTFDQLLVRRSSSLGRPQ